MTFHIDITTSPFLRCQVGQYGVKGKKIKNGGGEQVAEVPEVDKPSSFPSRSVLNWGQHDMNKAVRHDLRIFQVGYNTYPR